MDCNACISCGMVVLLVMTEVVGREVKLNRLPSDSIADRGHISLIIDRYYANCTDK